LREVIRNNSRGLGCSCYLLIPLGMTWLAAIRRPIFNERYLVIACPPFFLLLAAGLSPRMHAALRPSSSVCVRKTPFWRVAWTSLQVALLVVLLASMLMSLRRHYMERGYRADGWRELARNLERLSAGMPVEQVRLMQNFPDPSLWYYYRGPVAHAVLPPVAHGWPESLQEVQKLAADGVRRVILPLQPATVWDDQGLAQAALAREYVLIGETRLGVWPIQVYARAYPEDMSAVGATFATGLRLEAAAVLPSSRQGWGVPGGILAVHLLWGGPVTALTGSEKLFLHLLDADRAIVAQTDPFFTHSDLEAGLTSYGIFLPEELPPGTYRLIVGVYDPGQPGAPRESTLAGADHVELSMLSVTK